MNTNLLEYKGYHASVEFSSEDCLLVGKVCWVNDSLTFEGQTVHEVVSAFHETIDEYIALCQEIGKQPEKEFKGTLNIRMSPDLHRSAAISAAQSGTTLNQFIVNAISNSVHNDDHQAQDIANIIVSKLSSSSTGFTKKTLPYQTNPSILNFPVKYNDQRTSTCLSQ